MGCCASSEEAPIEAADVEVTEAEAGVTQVETTKISLDIAEVESLKAKPNTETFIGSLLKAQEFCSSDAAVLLDCCTRLQAYNGRIKEYVSIYDCECVNEAMNGGFMGLGCNDKRLIAAICTRTKLQLQRTKKTYRNMYDKDLREEIQGETDGGYRKLMYFILSSKEAYIADVIDYACNAGVLENGCDEIALLEVFVTHTQEELQAGKAKWEGRTDKSLVDYINAELGSSYRHLNRLLQLLFMGDREEAAEADEDKATEQVATLHEECEKGWFEDFDESAIIEIIGANSMAQNTLVAQLYEKEHGASLSSALKDQCGDRLHYALRALLMTKAEFVAMRLHDAMEGWGTDASTLTRLLGGLDGVKMDGVADAFEAKYDRPLWSALRAELDGDFLHAALAWVQTADAAGAAGVDDTRTEVDLGEQEGDAEALFATLDTLLQEYEKLLGLVAFLDVETLHEVTKGFGTDDTGLIRTIATRNKRCLARINAGYRNAHDTTLQSLLESELLGEGDADKNVWYAYLAKLLVVQEEQADAMILDHAMSGGAVDTDALTEFLVGRHPRRVRAAKETWEAKNDDSLVDKLHDSLDGTFLKLCLRMLKGKREVDDLANEEQAATQLTAIQAAVALLEDDGQTKPLEKLLLETLCENSPAENAELARQYEEAEDQSLRRFVKKVFDDATEEALISLLQGPYNWYAAELKKALTGDEVDDKTVCRIIGSHDKDEIKKIAESYEKKYSTTLKDAISDACSGNYKRLAVAWVDLTDQIAQPEKIIEFTPPPGPPVLEAPTVGVEAKLVDGAAAATVSWEETRPIFCTESGYTLTATPEGADEPAESAEPDPDAREYTFEGLTYGTTYTFELTRKGIAAIDGEEVVATADTVECTMPTPPEPALGELGGLAVEFALAEDGESVVATVTWEAPTAEHCELSGYEVTCTRTDEEAEPVTAEADADATSVEIEGLAVGAVYEVQVTAKAVGTGDSSTPDEELTAVASSGELEPTPKPTPVLLFAQSATSHTGEPAALSVEFTLAEDGESVSATVSWEAPTAEHCELSGYEVVYVWDTDAGQQSGTVQAEADATSVELEGLATGALFDMLCTAKAVGKVDGEELTATGFSGMLDRSPAPPPPEPALGELGGLAVEFALAEDGESVVATVTWEAPTAEHCELSGYEVTCTRTDEEAEPVTAEADADATSVEIEGLAVGAVYEVQVTAKAVGTGDSSTPDEELTAVASSGELEPTPLPPVTIVEPAQFEYVITTDSNDASQPYTDPQFGESNLALASWTRATTTNGEVDSYTVICTEIDEAGDPIEVFAREKYGPEGCGHIFVGVKAGATYKFELTTRAGEAFAEANDITATIPSTPPAQPQPKWLRPFEMRGHQWQVYRKVEARLTPGDQKLLKQGGMDRFKYWDQCEYALWFSLDRSQLPGRWLDPDTFATYPPSSSILYFTDECPFDVDIDKAIGWQETFDEDPEAHLQIYREDRSARRAQWTCDASEAPQGTPW